jgi:tRNA(Ile2) C34 agmatinyltransferase TiaS
VKRCPVCGHGLENLGDGEYRCQECGLPVREEVP